MEISEERKTALLSYCKVDAESEADVNEAISCYLAAVAYLRDGGVFELEAMDDLRRALFELCAFAVALDFLDRRGTVLETELKDNPALRRAITQLKFWCSFNSN